MKKIALISSVAIFAPLFAAAKGIDNAGVTDFFTDIQSLIGAALPVIISIAVLFFLWGLVKYMLNQDDAEARAGARSMMVWGIVIIFVMVSVWGLVNFLDSFFALDNTAGEAPGLPAIP